MKVWRTYEDFSDAFMVKHRELILYMTYHQLLAMLLYPLNCKCGMNCVCKELRKMIGLSLNVDQFERLQPELTDQDDVHNLKRLLQIPEDHYFRQNCGKLFPLRQIHQELNAKDANFKRVCHLVWAFLKLAKINRDRKKGNIVTLKGAQELALGKGPLKKKNDSDYLGGDKAYSDDLRDYKPLCHFLAAFEFSQEQAPHRRLESQLLDKTPEQIHHLFKRAQKIKCALPALKTKNVKDNTFFPEDILEDLPDWIENKTFELALNPTKEEPKAA